MRKFDRCGQLSQAATTFRPCRAQVFIYLVGEMSNPRREMIGSVIPLIPLRHVYLSHSSPGHAHVQAQHDRSDRFQLAPFWSYTGIQHKFIAVSLDQNVHLQPLGITAMLIDTSTSESFLRIAALSVGLYECVLIC